MSVQCNTYVMIGVTFPYETFKDKDEALELRLEPYQDSAFKGLHNHCGLCVLKDGMNGEFVAIGKVIAKSANHEGLVAPVKVQAYAADISEIKDNIRRSFGDLVDLPDFEVTPLVISFYR